MIHYLNYLLLLNHPWCELIKHMSLSLEVLKHGKVGFSKNSAISSRARNKLLKGDWLIRSCPVMYDFYQCFDQSVLSCLLHARDEMAGSLMNLTLSFFKAIRKSELFHGMFLERR